MTLRLIVRPEPIEQARPTRSLRFIATLEGGEAVIVVSHQPLVDGARALIDRGYDPAELLTMRQHDRPHDSFKALPISQWAKWTYSEEVKGLRQRAWIPFAVGAGGRGIDSRIGDGETPMAPPSRS